MESKKLINWNAVSLVLAGKGNVIRGNYVPEKYQDAVDEISDMVVPWLEKYQDGDIVETDAPLMYKAFGDQSKPGVFSSAAEELRQAGEKEPENAPKYGGHLIGISKEDEKDMLEIAEEQLSGVLKKKSTASGVDDGKQGAAVISKKDKIAALKGAVATIQSKSAKTDNVGRVIDKTPFGTTYVLIDDPNNKNNKVVRINDTFYTKLLVGKNLEFREFESAEDALRFFKSQVKL